MMEDLVQTVSDKLGIEPDKASRCVSIVLALVKSEGNSEKVDALFDKMPGADDLAQAGKASTSGGIFSMVSGIAGGPMAAVGKLQAEGLNLDQVQDLSNQVLEYAREKAGTDVVKQVTDTIPGLNKYI